MKNKLLRYAPAILWMILVFQFSSKTDLPITGSLTGDFLSKKMAHVFEYTVLMFLMYRAVGIKSTGRAFLYCLIFAFTDEIHQLFIPNRSGQLRDVGIDSLGLFISIFFIIKFKLWNSALLLHPPKKLKK
jgi:VanZ family protein